MKNEYISPTKYYIGIFKKNIMYVCMYIYSCFFSVSEESWPNISVD